MESNTRRLTAYVVCGACFLVGIVCYGAFSEPVPDEPVRIMFKGTAGRVLFDHKAHNSVSGYAIDCGECHHEDADDPGLCSECHDADSDVSLEDAFHGQCRGCHEDEDAGPVQCSACHVI